MGERTRWIRTACGLGLLVLLATPWAAWAGHEHHHFTNAYLLLMGRMTLPERTLEFRYVPEYSVQDTGDPSGDRVGHTVSLGYGLADAFSVFISTESPPQPRDASARFKHWAVEGIYRFSLEPVELSVHGSLGTADGKSEGNVGLMAFKAWQRWAFHGDALQSWDRREDGSRIEAAALHLGVYYRFALQGIAGLSLEAASRGEWSGAVTLGTFLGQNLFFGLDLERGLSRRAPDYHTALFLQWIR